MPYLPEPPAPPEPPKPVERIDFMAFNGLWRFGFLGFYFGIVFLTLPSVSGASVGQVLVLQLCWWAIARQLATQLHAFVCEFANEDAERAHARQMQEHAKQVIAAMEARPIRALKLNGRTGQFDPERDPFPEPLPLLDREMGVRARG